EIWLNNEKEQLESLQTPEFLQGARLDEPNWAAFWATLVLDTDAHTLLEGPPLTSSPSWAKLFVLLKRKPGMPLDDFRQYSLRTHAPKVLELPGLRRYLQCHVRDSYYAMGESRFDAIAQLWFDDARAIEAAIGSSHYRATILPDLAQFTDPKYVMTMAAKEHWIIGPEARGDSPEATSREPALTS
ncbi:MAG TPA: EthD domain-containing protein, partial [Thermoguttaceae bacterium]|nr:EthD domain-containing protein [Thermoguttaceae bacterium]